MRSENSGLLENARSLRRNMTPWENKLWYGFLRYYPIKFRRQFPVGRYILDFYCHPAALCVELDGSGHYEPSQMTYDAKRTEYLQSEGIQVLRFCNMDIDHNFDGVCTVIDRKVREILKAQESDS